MFMIILSTCNCMPNIFNFVPAVGICDSGEFSGSFAAYTWWVVLCCSVCYGAVQWPVH